MVETLASINSQEVPEGIALRVIVADNDDHPEAEERVTRAAEAMRVPVLYLHAPRRNISLARNACLEAADADWAAFIDDDEVAAPDWIARLLSCAAAEGADVVFGPAIAEYPSDAPGWAVENDFHSNIPLRRNGVVETGHTCNVLMRFRGTPVATNRFDLALGQSGGEDTDFFFRLHKAGLQMTLCDNAIVHEAVSPHRLNLRWLAERRFAEGVHYAASAPKSRPKMFLGSLAKIGYSTLRMIGASGRQPRAVFWLMRAVFHLGVCSGSVTRLRRVSYGTG